MDFMDQTQALDISDEDATTMDISGVQKPVPVGTLVVFAQRNFPETSFLIREGDNVVGRCADVAHIHIPIKVLSKRHAVIEVDNAAHFIYDAGSHNKTYKGKALLKPHARYELIDGELLKFADVKCIYYKRNIISTCSTDETESVGDTETILAGPSTTSAQNSHQHLAKEMRKVKVTPKKVSRKLPSSEDATQRFELKSDSEVDEDDGAIQPEPRKALFVPETPISLAKHENTCRTLSSGLQTSMFVPETDSDTDLEDALADTTVQPTAKQNEEPSKCPYPAVDSKNDWQDMATQLFVLDKESDSEGTDRGPTKENNSNSAPQQTTDVIPQGAVMQATSSEETCVSLLVVDTTSAQPPNERPITCSIDSELQSVQNEVSRILQSSVLSPDSAVSRIDSSNHQTNVLASDASDVTKSGVEISLDTNKRKSEDETDKHRNEDMLEENNACDRRSPPRRTSRKSEIRKPANDDDEIPAAPTDIRVRSSRVSLETNKRKSEGETEDGNEDVSEENYSGNRRPSPQTASKNSRKSEFRKSANDSEKMIAAPTDVRARSSREKTKRAELEPDDVSNDFAAEPTTSSVRKSRRVTSKSPTEKKSNSETSTGMSPARQDKVETVSAISAPSRTRGRRAAAKTSPQDERTASTETPNRRAPRKSHVDDATPCVRSSQTAETESASGEQKLNNETAKMKNPRSRISFQDVEPENGYVSSTPKATKRKSDRIDPSEPKSAKSTKLLQSPRVMFTGMNEARLEKAVTDLGGQLVESVFECTHLITDKIRRSLKFLCVLARGQQIVGGDWLEACMKAKHFVDSSPFILSDKETENRYEFVLRDSLEVAKKNGLLSGFSVHTTKSVVPIPEQFSTIIECAGGKYLKRMPRAGTDSGNKVVVISCTADLKLCLAAIRAEIPVVSPEFLLTGLLRQNVDIESNVLPEVRSSLNDTKDSDEVAKVTKRKSRR